MDPDMSDSDDESIIEQCNERRLTRVLSEKPVEFSGTNIYIYMYYLQ